MRVSRLTSSCLVFVTGLVLASASSAVAAEPAWVKGTLTGNGQVVELPYVYIYALEEGFYDPADPTWKIIFVEHEIAEREIDEPVWDSALVELGITRTAEFGDQPTLQVYSQSIRLSADEGGNISGGTYPKLELESAGPERFAGRVYLPDEQEIFDSTFQFDFTFSAPLSDPNAPIGDPLPADGGEPGKAYRAWVAAIHARDLEGLKKLVPPDMAAQLDAEDAQENLDFLVEMTPTSVKVLSGSSDGQTALLLVEAVMAGETVRGEITLERTGGVWMATRTSW